MSRIDNEEQIYIEEEDYEGRPVKNKKHRKHKDAEKSPEMKIKEHLTAMDEYFDKIKLTEEQKEGRRLKHLEWVKSKLSMDVMMIDPYREIIIKKVDGGVGDGPIAYNAINPGSGIVHRFVVPRDYESADESRPVVVKKVNSYLKLWRSVSPDFKKQLDM